MEKTILWEGLADHSLEYCTARFAKAGLRVTATVIGFLRKSPFRLEYYFKTDPYFHLRTLHIVYIHSRKRTMISLTSDGKGHWFRNGRIVNKFNGCIDVDISLTPFTNTLPIRRLNFSEKKEQVIKVLYFNARDQKLQVVHQKYTRLAKTKFKYENIPNDFEAILEVDNAGVVKEYPGLFRRC